jgi:hypothetical protein
MSNNAHTYIIGQNGENKILIWGKDEHFEQIPVGTEITVEGIDVYDGKFIKTAVAGDLSIFVDEKHHIVEMHLGKKEWKCIYWDSELTFRFDGGKLTYKNSEVY